MAEMTEMMRVWLTLASLAVSLFTLTILVLLFLLVRRALEAFKRDPILPTSAAVVTSGAAALVAQRKAVAEEKRKPGRSCGHCGVRIKGDPIRGVAFEDKSYLAFQCPECKKETLLAQ